MIEMESVVTTSSICIVKPTNTSDAFVIKVNSDVEYIEFSFIIERFRSNNRPFTEAIRIMIPPQLFCNDYGMIHREKPDGEDEDFLTYSSIGNDEYAVRIVSDTIPNQPFFVFEIKLENA